MLSAKQVNLYFTSNKMGLLLSCIFFAVVGIVLLVSVNWIAGLISIGIAIVSGYIRTMVPSDAEIDAFFNKLADFRVKQSLEKLGIEESDIVRQPLSIIGVGDYELSKEGDDGVWRYNPMKVEIIHFGKNQLLTNSVQLDLLNPKEYVGKTNEFFYKDISSVSIEDYKDDDSGGFNKHFLIKVHGQIELNTGIQKKYETTAEDAVSTIRKTLREKKQD